ARAHVVVVGLAGRAFFVVDLAAVAGEDTVPAAVFVVDEMRPRVFPQAPVPVPVLVLAGARRQQRRAGQRFGLHPVVFVIVADRAVWREAVTQPAVLTVPRACNGGVEQVPRGREQPVRVAMTGHDQQQLGPFGLMAGLETPRAEQVFRVVLVVLPIDFPVFIVVFPHQTTSLGGLPACHV